MTVTERGTITRGSLPSTSNTVPFPTGLAVGDLIVLVSASDFRRSGGLTGWTVLFDDYVSAMGGLLAYKVATSTEVSAGSVTLTLAGGAAGTYACVAIQAGTFDTLSPVRVVGHKTLTAGNSTIPNGTGATQTLASSRIYYWAARDANPTDQTLSCSVGTLVFAGTNTSNGYKSSHALYAEDITSSVARTPTWSATPTAASYTGSTFITFEISAPYAGAGFDTEIAKSLEAWWKLDETSGTTAADSSGNARSATYGATAVLAQAPIRGGGTGAAKATAGEVASIASATWMNRTTFTATIWVKVGTATGDRGYMGRYPSAGQGAWLIWQNSAGAYPGTSAPQFSALVSSSTSPLVDMPVQPVVADVHFLALTWDGTSVTYYIDGHTLGPIASPGTAVAGNQGIGIGAYRSDGTNPANATLQDATFHSAALTGADIFAIWQGRAGAGTGGGGGGGGGTTAAIFRGSPSRTRSRSRTRA